VNYFSHLWVAGQVGPIGPAEALGAMLPDVLAMAGAKADPGRLPPAVLVGRDIHHRTDRSFHRHPDFVALVARLRRALVTAGLPAGAAHAGAHAGNELLLDGTLPDGSVAGAFVGALGLAHVVHPALASDDRARFDRVVDRVSRDRPSRLADPDAVAERLFRVLGRRTRLAFAAGQIADLARALTEHRPSVVETSGALLASVVHGLDRPGDRYPGSMAGARGASPGG
jgi:hypothetical protein